MLRILFLTHRFHPDLGGIEVNSEILASQFAKAGHKVRLVTWSGKTSPDSFPYTVIRRPSMRQLIRELRWADVVYENNICLRLSWPAALLQRPSVIALRTWVERIDGRRAFQDRLKLRWLARARAVIAVSDAVRDKCWPDAVTIGNPYRSDLFARQPEVSKDLDFAFLGRLVSDKGADLAVRALHAINSRAAGEPATLSIIGEGPEKQNLERLAADLKQTDHVRFTGVLRGLELVAELNRHRYLWAPSRWEEPFGNVALEGMACGCIPIVSSGGGFPDAVGDAGLVFKRGDLADLVAKSDHLLTDGDLRERLTEAASAHLERHRPENVARAYLDVIEGAVGQ